MPRPFFMSCAMAICTLAPAPAIAQPTRVIEAFRSDLSPAEIETATQGNLQSLASQAYLWGLPAFLHFRQTTEIKQARKLMAPAEEPFGGWVLLRKLATPQDAANVMPNVDTLYGAAYLLLDKQGPVVLSVPRVKNRYYSVALHDAYFNTFGVAGTRETGGEAAEILILPPGYRLPVQGRFTKIIRAPTSGVAVFQRIYTRDESDVEAVQAIQSKIRLTPLERWRVGQTGFPQIETPEFDTATPVRSTRDIARYFEVVAAHTCRNPPPADYAALVDAFKRVNLGPCSKAPVASHVRAIEQGGEAARALIDARISTAPLRNGWQIPDPNTGKASLDYTGRAIVQLTQIGSFSPDEAMYFVGRKDSAGRSLTGALNYSITFAKDETPPVDRRAFWSLTMYDGKTNLLVDNPLNRYIIRPATPGLKWNSDGSLTIHVSHQRDTTVPEGNWLPAPSGDFIVVLRTYLPSEAIQRGEWFPPALEQKLQ